MDRRTKRQKLQDMANQSVSPNEAEIAKEKLENTPQDDPIEEQISFRVEIRQNSPDPDAWMTGFWWFDFAKNEWHQIK